MPASTHTTTIEVKGDTYKALDRIRDQGDSFDDAVRRLIENTAAGLQGFTADAPTVNTGEVEPIQEDPVGLACAEVDPVTGDMCENEVAYQQEYSFGAGDDGGYFYYCAEHAPDSSKS